MYSPADSPSWLWAASILSALAGTGGIVVLVGLWFEGYKRPETFRDVNEQRTHHTREGRGIKFVFWGVFVEVLVAFALTFKEAHDAHRTELEIAKNDPLNAPINDVSAIVRLRVKGVKGPVGSPENGIFKPLAQDDVARGSIRFIEGTNSAKSIYTLSFSQQDVGVVGSGIVRGEEDWRGVILKFHEDDLQVLFSDGFVSNNFENGPILRTFNTIGGIIISLPQMESNVIVVSGTVELKGNNLRWWFPIPSERQSSGFITSQISTNATGQKEAKVLPIIIRDWVTPPRFPDRVFDGK